MQVPRWWQRQRARLVRLRPLAWWVVVGLMVVGLARVETTVARLEVETQERKEQSCVNARRGRRELRDLLEYFASGRERFLDRVNEYYDELPPPTACEDDGDG